MQTACGGTQYRIPDAAVSEADVAADSAYSVAMSAEGGGGSTTRARATKSWHGGTTATTVRPSVSFGVSKSGFEMISSTASSSLASSSVASVGATIGVARASGPIATASASTGPSASTRTSAVHESSGGGGTPLDVGQQGTGLKKRAGSLLGLAIAVVVGVWL